MHMPLQPCRGIAHTLYQQALDTDSLVTILSDHAREIPSTLCISIRLNEHFQ